jgi:hypothetical protein
MLKRASTPAVPTYAEARERRSLNCAWAIYCNDARLERSTAGAVQVVTYKHNRIVATVPAAVARDAMAILAAFDPEEYGTLSISEPIVPLVAADTPPGTAAGAPAAHDLGAGCHTGSATVTTPPLGVSRTRPRSFHAAADSRG